MAGATIDEVIVGGCAMTTAVCHRMAAQRGVIAEIPACPWVRRVAPNGWLAVRVATEVVEAKTFIRVTSGSSAVKVWKLTRPHLALLPVASHCLAASVVPSVAPSVGLVAHVPLWLAELPA